MGDFFSVCTFFDFFPMSVFFSLHYLSCNFTLSCVCFKKRFFVGILLIFNPRLFFLIPSLTATFLCSPVTKPDFGLVTHGLSA